MKCIYTLFITLVTLPLIAQTNTEIHLFGLSQKNGQLKLSPSKNISNSKGYNSQPFFMEDNKIIYAGTRDGNTEIIQYEKGDEIVFNKSTKGGEYSPQPIPGSPSISAVRLDPDGYQRLYAYNNKNRTSEEIMKNAVVAYYVWKDATTVVSADIVDEKLHLVIHNTSTQKSVDLGIEVGRSFHKIPSSNLVSFIDKSKTPWEVKSIDTETQEINQITTLPSGIEDINWLDSNTLLATKGNSLYIKQNGKDWELLKRFEDKNLQTLSRIAVSKDRSLLAIVSETMSKK